MAARAASERPPHPQPAQRQHHDRRRQPHGTVGRSAVQLESQSIEGTSRRAQVTLCELVRRLGQQPPGVVDKQEANRFERSSTRQRALPHGSVAVDHSLLGLELG